MEGLKRARGEEEDADAAAPSAREAEMRELLAAREAQHAAALAERDAALAERDAALAARGAAEAAAAAERGAARADRAFARALLARDATLAAALAERDELLALVGGAAGLRAARLGERLLDVLPIVAAMGYACEVSHCLYLCGVTWRKGDKGATNDMIIKSLERQCGATAARVAAREDFSFPMDGSPFVQEGTTQLMRAVILNNLPRVLQLVMLGAPLDVFDKSDADTVYSALHWACDRGHEQVTRALLDGKYEGHGATVDIEGGRGWTPLMSASISGHFDVVRLLLARGAKVEARNINGDTASSVATSDEIRALLAAHAAE